MARFISEYRQLETARDNGCGELQLQKSASDVSIGLLIGTPAEVSKLIEEGRVVPDEIKYLVCCELFILHLSLKIKFYLTFFLHGNWY